MAGAVEYGTARRLRASFTELPVFGKTGTCSNEGTRYGWFASYSDSPQGSLVTVFFLEGGRPTFGPRAAELTGAFYRNLWDHEYFTAKAQTSVHSRSGFDSAAGLAAARFGRRSISYRRAADRGAEKRPPSAAFCVLVSERHCEEMRCVRCRLRRGR